MTTDRSVDRRGFLSIATWLIGSLVAAAYAIPAIGYLVGPAFQRRAERWLPLGATSKVGLEQPTLFKVNVENQTGWITDRQEIAAYVLTDNGRDYIAMSNVCTHLGCHVRWVEKQGRFYCPCHNGVFDREGNVLSGPPPRPLDRYQTQVKDDELLIRVD
ncbi:MAG: ubiquinol-cytochrome c reductase iron-sulfur subunit [Anaerolineales bacterium]